MERPAEPAADEMAGNPHDRRMTGLKSAEAEPDVGPLEEIEMGGDTEPVDRKIHDLNRDSRRAALPQGGTHLDVDTL